MDKDLFASAYVPRWIEQLKALAEMALPEPWKFKEPELVRKNVDFVILERYINSVFSSQVIAYGNATSQNEADMRFCIREGYACFHTGLLSKRYKEIYGYLEKNRNDWAEQPYVLRGFIDDSHPFLKKVETLPLKPLTSIRMEQYGFRPDWPIRININHMLDDESNYGRIPEQIRSFANLPLLLQASVDMARKVAEFTPSIVVPQMYCGSIQNLLPICLTNPTKPDLAMTVTGMDNYYVGSTCITLEMAYCNARMLAVPTAPWLTALVE